MAETNSSIDVSTPTREGFSITATTPQTLNVNADAVTQKMDITASSTTPLGLSVTPDLSMYYSDVSKGYAEQAEASAQRAENSADVANEAVKNILESEQVQAIFDNLEIIEAAPENAQVAQEQALLSKGYADIANESAITASQKADVATEQANIILEQVALAETYADNANTSAVSADASANSAKEYTENAKASALVATEQATIATNQAESARLKAIEATEQASNALASSDSAKTSENNAKVSESNALASELSANEYKLRCEEIFQRIGTVIKIKGRVDNYDDLPTENNIDGDAYLVGADGLDAYPEYYWFADHWEYLGTSATSLLWGSITGTLANQTDLQTALDEKLSNKSKNNHAISIASGADTATSNIGGIAIGQNATAGTYSVAIGDLAKATNKRAVQLGKGTNTEAGALYFGNDSGNYKLLDISGKIPDDRLSTNIAKLTDIPDISNLATKDEIPDLSNYVRNTDYATSDNAGVVKVDIVTGINTDSTGKVYIAKATDNLVTAKTNNYRPLVPSNIDLAVKTGVTTNTIELTDEEKKNAQEWLGISSGTLNMFDTVLKDHILTYEESKGLALQGTYVYKEAIAGSRYGYPDFYNKCLEEYLNSSNTKQWLKSNVTNVGSIVDTQGVLTGFTTANYVTLPKMFEVNQDTESWECQLKLNFSDDTTIGTILDLGFDGVADYRLELGQLTTSDDITTRHFCFVSHSMGSLGVGVASYGQAEVLANTTYFIRYGFDKTARVIYLDYSLTGEEGSYIRDTAYGVSSMNKKILYAPIIGNDDENNALTTMTVDLNYSYIKIDGKIWWSGTDTLNTNSNGHRFYDIAQKPYIDEIFTSTGRAWMYGVDTENERIFLPRNSKYFRIGDESTVGTNQDAGLPNITGTAGKVARNESITGAFYGKSGVSGKTGEGGDTDTLVSFDASRSSAIYGNSDTVEVDSVNMLLYICVGNTESEEALTNVIDITTTENDTIPLGYSTYQNGTQPSISWLKSEGQWNDGNVYTTFYNEFVQKIGQAFASGTVVEYTSEYTDYDLVINQTDMTFRLPLLDGSEDIISDKYETIPYTSSGYVYTAPRNGRAYWERVSGATTNVFLAIANRRTGETSRSFEAGSATNILTTSINALKGDELHFTCSATSNTWTCKFFYAQGNGSLYFKVANAVQNLELLNAGEVLEAVSNIVPNNRDLITSYCCPDWNNAIDYANNTTVNTAPANGYVVMHYNYKGTNGQFKINGTIIGTAVGNSNYRGTFNGMYIVNKGDTFQITQTATSDSSTPLVYKFVPMKGAN